MNKLVPEKSDAKRDERDDDDTDSGRDLVVGDGLQGLSTGDGVDDRPSDTGDAIQRRDQLSTVTPPTETSRGHLAETELGPKGRHECGDEGGDGVEEEDGEPGLVSDGFSDSAGGRTSSHRVP